MKKLFFPILLLTSMTISAQTVIEIPVWPNGAKESNGITATETSDDAGRISNIKEASFKVYLADKAKNTGIAILICPGGGYGIEAATHEGTDYAQWFAENGITGVVMKYRLPNGHHEIPLKDVQEAMRILRNKASEWGISPNKIGVSGFSAGGHLASTLLTHFDETSRPDFGVLFYPVITFGEINTHIGSRKNLLGENEKNQDLIDYYSNEKHITGNTPPTILLLSDDDKAVVPENSILFYSGLKENNIPSSLYIFPIGGHGWGFKKDFRYHEQMKELVLKWLEQQKIK